MLKLMAEKSWNFHTVVGRVILLLERNFSLFVWYNLLDDGLTRDKKVVEGLQLDLGATTMQ